MLESLKPGFQHVNPLDIGSHGGLSGDLAAPQACGEGGNTTGYERIGGQFLHCVFLLS